MEREADYIGLQLMSKACFDPHEMPAVRAESLKGCCRTTPPVAQSDYFVGCSAVSLCSFFDSLDLTAMRTIYVRSKCMHVCATVSLSGVMRNLPRDSSRTITAWRTSTATVVATRAC